MKCRHCQNTLQHHFLDLGSTPLSNAYLTQADLSKDEMTYPLRLYVCEHCWLVQTEDYANCDQMFTKDYAYFSSTSKTMLEHAKNYAYMIIKKNHLTSDHFVIEIASNDGYLLRNFVDANIPCLGIEPTQSTADAAEKIGIPVLKKFFNSETATELAKNGKQADLICGNNVYAHVPDINDFTKGLKIALKKYGTITLEFPHLLNLMAYNQFDTVYHEHFSYLSLHVVKRIFEQASLRLFDVEELPIHGGSLRVYGCHHEDPRKTLSSVDSILTKEEQFGLQDLKIYHNFQKKAEKIKQDFIAFLLEQKKLGKKIAAYGAAAKGNTLLNYAGVKHDLIDYVCDASPSKQDKFMPGSKIPIVSPKILFEKTPDWLVILPWNIVNEIKHQLTGCATNFVVAIPELRVIT